MHSTANPKILILGGGLDGLVAALSLRARGSNIDITVLRPPNLSAPLPDESTDAALPSFLHDFLGISPARLHHSVKPVWKLGSRLEWGPREDFLLTYDPQFTQIPKGVTKAAGYYAAVEIQDISRSAAFIRRDKAFPTGPLGKPALQGGYGYHLKSEPLLELLETLAKEQGIQILDEEIIRVDSANGELRGVHLQQSGQLEADLYVDASGQAAAWIRGELGVEFLKFSSLIADAWCAVRVPRPEGPIHPHTTFRTQPHGWSWQIEHEDSIQVGQVFSSEHHAAEDIEALLRETHPEASAPLRGTFQRGHVETPWVGNVVAIGAAMGDAEPLVTGRLSQLAHECRWLAELLEACAFCPGEVERQFYCRRTLALRKEARDLTALLHAHNHRLDTPFWITSRAQAQFADLENFLAAYREIGPSPLLGASLPTQPSAYGLEGYLALLIGLRLPFDNVHLTQPEETERVHQAHRRHAQTAATALGVREILAATRTPSWNWS
ncbi:tryptophan halogenase [Haloferula luteola]|uniref:Tryptophan halogenase n=1 Tax=Haloferula luteola TaxID=595692 RepID=A0A840V4N8_9BACT|nr:tryptophan 7-halogenase [Haloferula luteola]MBB5352523.1 tryptophan halogenase [Haloferula luteola]